MNGEFDAVGWLQRQLEQAQRHAQRFQDDVDMYKFDLQRAENSLRDVQAKVEAIQLIITRTQVEASTK